MNLEYVYQLRLPELYDSIIPGSIERLSSLPVSTDKPYNYIKASDLFKSEHLNIAGVLWDSAIHFYKTGNKFGTIHSDVADPTDNTIRVGINLVYSGSGIMEYFDNIQGNSNSHNNTDHRVLNIVPGSPSKSYSLNSGNVYLINASPYHRASGSDRHIISLRSSQLVKSDWSEIVKMFAGVIKC